MSIRVPLGCTVHFAHKQFDEIAFSYVEVYTEPLAFIVDKIEGVGKSQLVLIEIYGRFQIGNCIADMSQSCYHD